MWHDEACHLRLTWNKTSNVVRNSAPVGLTDSVSGNRRGTRQDSEMIKLLRVKLRLCQLCGLALGSFLSLLKLTRNTWCQCHWRRCLCCQKAYSFWLQKKKKEEKLLRSFNLAVTLTLFESILLLIVTTGYNDDLDKSYKYSTPHYWNAAQMNWRGTDRKTEGVRTQV